MSNIERSLELFEQQYNCCQSVYAAYAPELGIDREHALKATSTMGGGVARMGETCGAVTGALMVLGLARGTDECNKEAKEETYRIAKEFVAEFKEHHGSIICKDLLGCDMSTPEGMEMSKEKAFHKTLCPKFVKDAAEILEKML